MALFLWRPLTNTALPCLVSSTVWPAPLILWHLHFSVLCTSVCPPPTTTTLKITGYILWLHSLLCTSWNVLPHWIFCSLCGVFLSRLTSSVMFSTVAISHMWLLKYKLMQLSKTESSVLQCHQPHFKCSVATCDRWLLFWDSAHREHFYHRRKFCWSALLSSYPRPD